MKPVYSDHPWDPEKVVVIQRWSLFRGGRYSEVVVIQRVNLSNYYFLIEYCTMKTEGGVSKMLYQGLEKPILIKIRNTV